MIYDEVDRLIMNLEDRIWETSLWTIIEKVIDICE